MSLYIGRVSAPWARVCYDRPMLSDTQHRAIELIAQGQPYRAVAREVGVQVLDMVEWSTDPEWAEALSEARAQVTGEASAMLSGQAPRAVSTVVERIDALVAIADGEGKDADRIRAGEAAAKLSLALLDRIGLGPSSSVEHTVTRAGADEYDVSLLTDDEVAALDATLERMRNGGHEH